MTFNQNKLGNDPSPYLQQHKNNPVNWQTWNKDILEISKKSSLVGLLNINDIIIEVQKTPITKSVDLNNNCSRSTHLLFFSPTGALIFPL